MSKNVVSFLSLFFVLLLCGCSLVPNLSGGKARAVLMPQYLAVQYGTQTVINPNLSADIDHLTLELRYTPSLTLVANRDIPKGELTNPIVFNNLRANTGYRVVATAYKTADTSQVISTADADSYTEFSTTNDDAPAIVPLKVKLKDVAFSGVGTSSFSVTPGSFVTGTSKMSITCKGKVFTLAGVASGADGIGLRANFASVLGLALGNGAIYISDSICIRKLDLATNAVTTIAGNKSSSGFADGTGTAAKFASPFGLAFDNNYLYVADFDNNRIRRVDLSTNAVTTIAGQSTAGTADGTGTACQFWRPYSLVVDNGFLYISDHTNNRIRKLALASNEVTTIAGQSAAGTADGTGTAAQFFNPAGLAVANGYLYVADKGNNRIRRLGLASNEVTTIAGQSTAGTADGTGTAAKFYNPSFLAVDNGFLYVSDEINNRIRKLELATNAVTTLAGSSAGTADGTGTAAQFNHPNGLVINDGSLYVADYTTDRIRKVTLSSNAVITIAGGPVSAGYTDGAGASVRMNAPQSLALGAGYLYFVDINNNRIRRIDLATNDVTTIAGQSASGFADGTGAAAQFYGPRGLALDNGYLYVGDYYNNRIRRIDLATYEVKTIAGQNSSGSADGTGTAATFYRPAGLAVDNGFLYVVDQSNYRIRRIELATSAVTTIGTVASFPVGITVQNGIVYCPYYSSGNKMWKYNIAAGTGGVVSSAGSYNASMITADDDGYLYITGDACVWKLNPTTNTIVQFLGGPSGYADGTGTAAQFCGPSGIVMDKDNGILYISDSSNNCIRIVY